MSSNHYAGYSDAYSANALIRMTIDDSELRQGLESTKDAFKQLQMKLFSIGRNMETIGRQIAAPFQAAAKVFADFDDQMRRVAAVTGAIGKGGRNNGGPWWSTLHGARRIILTY
ncbi:MAG: hypothetical protein MJ106_07055 [Lentisphaeria bacterium]|nr:hypothetical protein [Lentisphaeria bacterium]